ncbi:hypothetical protein CAEBREN_15546 [Caenorhabditis brenneri]|uniref:SKP1 component POZ domain-containing protein n=1 Tax=Caenorhabditis brenneri TaxID=135651 RepID=G0MX19_CAEBE|nr:hypothetical protein CAEBREN_15546 [Caenorhabditis brenneri]
MAAEQLDVVPHAADDSPERFYKLVSRDGVEFQVSERAVRHSELLIRLFAILNIGPGNEEAFMLNYHTGRTLNMLFQWLDHYKDDPILLNNNPEALNNVEVSEFDRNLLGINDYNLLINVMSAAECFRVRRLFKVVCAILGNLGGDNAREEERRELPVVMEEENEDDDLVADDEDDDFMEAAERIYASARNYNPDASEREY